MSEFLLMNHILLLALLGRLHLNRHSATVRTENNDSLVASYNVISDFVANQLGLV